jgi:hypothetical protein
VIRFFHPQGTLVVEVDDPGISVAVEGEDIIITGTRMKEIRLKPGSYRLLARKQGQLVREELVTVSKNQRRVLRISRESSPLASERRAGKPSRSPANARRGRSLSSLNPQRQVAAVAAHLKQLNPDFDGILKHEARDGVVVAIELRTDHVQDLSPLRDLPELESLQCVASKGEALQSIVPLQGLQLRRLVLTGNINLRDLAPLRGMPLESLNVHDVGISDLSPLNAMPLTELHCGCTRVTSLEPLRGMRLTVLNVDHDRIDDLAPLQGMPLTELCCGNTLVSDLTPLRGMKLTRLRCGGTGVTDLAVIRDMPLEQVVCSFNEQRDSQILRSIPTLRDINYQPADRFWKSLADQSG